MAYKHNFRPIISQQAGRKMHMQQNLQAVMCYTPINAMTGPFHGDVLTGYYFAEGVNDGEDIDTR